MSERKIKGAKYIGKSSTFIVGTTPVPPDTIITSPPDAVDAMCTHPECDIIYETPEEEGPPASSLEEER